MATPFASPVSPRLIRLPEVMRQTGLSRSTIYEAIKRGDFPKPVSLTSTARAWHSEEIDAWITERRAARDARFSLSKSTSDVVPGGRHDET
ncbi:helix-turn-helix transcriptional regulator [Dyella lutea]|uniref:AlpA family transcriptional regulator n=1 Tax=Dyella lutea TaxID=2950441 RepID=A0ABT1FEZ0_9GAMM|nr:AlpA family transcriptional regulator [Dyella lutea]MCP1375927.1 AlpA family transcriptional regulator [Dyella lutea]